MSRITILIVAFVAAACVGGYIVYREATSTPASLPHGVAIGTCLNCPIGNPYFQLAPGSCPNGYLCPTTLHLLVDNEGQVPIVGFSIFLNGIDVFDASLSNAGVNQINPRGSLAVTAPIPSDISITPCVNYIVTVVAAFSDGSTAGSPPVNAEAVASTGCGK